MKTAELSEDSLLSAGYKKYPPPSRERYDTLYQKRIRDAAGTRYFVNIRFWRFSKYSTEDEQVPDGWDAWVQYNSHSYSTHPTFNVELSCREITPAQVEGFYDRVWSLMGCDYYERDDDS